jgi:hypothetical protein
MTRSRWVSTKQSIYLNKLTSSHSLAAKFQGEYLQLLRSPSQPSRLRCGNRAHGRLPRSFPACLRRFTLHTSPCDPWTRYLYSNRWSLQIYVNSDVPYHDVPIDARKPSGPSSRSNSRYYPINTPYNTCSASLRLYPTLLETDCLSNRNLGLANPVGDPSSILSPPSWTFSGHEHHSTPRAK